jgi:hypothetical protein
MGADAAVTKEGRNRRMAALFVVAGVVLLSLAAAIGINDNLPGIASMIVGLFGVALGIVYGLTKPGGRTPGQQLLYWAPRALCIVFALFISLFALDVFGGGRGIRETAVALLMHLIPTFLLIIFLVISWRREWIAGLVFPVLAVIYVMWSLGKPFAGWGVWLLIAGPLVLTGVLFLLNWYYLRRHATQV